MPPPPEFAVETLDLAKTYPGRNGQPAVRALRGVSLRVPKGAFFGLLGPNGAGKSTLINILAGLVVRSSGEARIWGFDIDRQMRSARRSIGIVPQELNLDPFFTPRELLELQAGLYGVPRRERRTDDILDAVGLTGQADAYARSLSGGMRRRLLVAKAMVHAPRVLVLDEPTAGVDVELRRHLWTYVRALNAAGTTRFRLPILPCRCITHWRDCCPSPPATAGDTPRSPPAPRASLPPCRKPQPASAKPRPRWSGSSVTTCRSPDRSRTFTTPRKSAWPSPCR